MPKPRRVTDAIASVAALAAVTLAALAACSATADPSCSWYTPVTTGGAYRGQVVVAATGAACTTPALIRWIADRTGRVWTSTTLRPAGFELADMTRPGSAVTVWIDGPTSGPAGPAAGELADDLEAAGWAPVIP